MNVPARRWLSIAEAAELLGVSTRTASRWATAGDLPALRIRHTLRVDAQALEEIYRRQQGGVGGRPSDRPRHPMNELKTGPRGQRFGNRAPRLLPGRPREAGYCSGENESGRPQR